MTTDTVAAVWPKAEDSASPTSCAAFGLQFGHGLGLALHERPIIWRLVSLDNPMEIKTGMVFALETYCPATDGYSAARIEEEVVVTDKGCRVITPSRRKTCRSPTRIDRGHGEPTGSGGPLRSPRNDDIGQETRLVCPACR